MAATRSQMSQSCLPNSSPFLPGLLSLVSPETRTQSTQTTAIEKVSLHSRPNHTHHRTPKSSRRWRRKAKERRNRNFTDGSRRDCQWFCFAKRARLMIAPEFRARLLKLSSRPSLIIIKRLSGMEWRANEKHIRAHKAHCRPSLSSVKENWWWLKWKLDEMKTMQRRRSDCADLINVGQPVSSYEYS